MGNSENPSPGKNEVSDAEALKAKQRELEVQTAFLKSIVENIPTAIFIKDIRDQFRVTLWNKSAEEIFQVKREDIIGKTAHDLWPKEQADLYLEADRQVVRGNKLVDTPEEPSRTIDRGTIYLHTVKLPLITSDGSEPEYLLAISNDITRHKQVTAELQAAKEAAESANRAKSEFLAMMSHEIRTPLNGVIGMANLLRNTPLTEEQAGMVGTMELSGKILLGLIDDILDYSKIEAGRMEVEILPFQMEDTLTEIADLMRSQAEKKGLALTTSFPAGLSMKASGDPVRIRQVLMNLIGNAIKFTPAGSVSLSARIENGSVRADILDTGIGIAEEARPRIFSRFTQADASTTRKFGGTGLGLAISKRLMELMGGTLEFTSVPGQGSTFSLTLPLAAPASEGAKAPLHKQQSAPAERIALGLRVLLAEDNLVNQKVGVKILNSLGCAVDVAPTGGEAVALAKKNPYDIVLMDIHMPEMDGLDATRAIRAWEASASSAGSGPDRPRLPIIALSASAMQNDRNTAREAGMDEFLTKPILAEDLTRILRVTTGK